MDIPIYCDLEALSHDERVRLHRLTVELLARTVSLRGDDTGYDLEFDGNGPEFAAQLMDFLEMDSRCCQFVEHTITLPAGRGNIRASLRGGPGAGAALKDGIEGSVPAGVLDAANVG